MPDPKALIDSPSASSPSHSVGRGWGWGLPDVLGLTGLGLLGAGLWHAWGWEAAAVVVGAILLVLAVVMGRASAPSLPSGEGVGGGVGGRP